MERFGSGRHLGVGLSIKCDILWVRNMLSAGVCLITESTCLLKRSTQHRL